MDWRDEGVLLTSRPHGETSMIIEVFTPNHGRHAGLVRGGVSRRLQPVLQPGSQLDLTWRARLEDHIGTFTVEPVSARAALLSDRIALAGLNAVAGLTAFALPERAPHPDLYRLTIALLDLMDQGADWPYHYLNWELALLEEMGFGLDLTACAVTGRANDLAFVSPKTGRAVSREGAGEWADRLLPLPACLLGVPPQSRAELLEALTTTGHFLRHHLAPSLGPRPLPEARARLIAALSR